MATLAFNHEEIAARELKPELLELHGISRAAVEAHYKLYQGYVAKRNEILGKLAEADLAAREPGLLGVPRAQGRSQLRGRRRQEPRDLLRAPRRRRRATRTARWPSSSGATSAASTRGAPTSRRPGMAGRGWAWTAYDWDEGRLFNYVGDAQNTFPVWNATPLVALDVYEHAYFLDYQTDRGSYIDAFFDNLDWGVVNDWIARLPDPGLAPRVRVVRSDRSRPRRRRLPDRLAAVGLLAAALAQGRRHPHGREREHRRDERLADVRLQARPRRRAARHRQGRGRRAARPLARRRPRRPAGRRRRGGRALPPDLPALRPRGKGGRGGRRRRTCARAVRDAVRRSGLDPRVPRDALRVASPRSSPR